MLVTFWNASFFGAPRVRKTEHLHDSTPTFCHVAFAKICPVVENVFCTEDAHRTFSMPHTLNWQLQNWRDSRLQILATRHLNSFTWGSGAPNSIQVVQLWVEGGHSNYHGKGEHKAKIKSAEAFAEQIFAVHRLWSKAIIVQWRWSGMAIMPPCHVVPWGVEGAEEHCGWN